MTSRFRKPLKRWHGSAVLRTGLLLLASTSLWANPTGGNVAAGSAQIAGQGTSAVTVTQGSHVAIINWQTFSINPGEATTFLQPSATSAVLNRVLGGQTSLINGTLTANGQIYLVNGNGVIVGPGGAINANAFTASTRDITDADFLSGNLHFTGSGGAGVQNLGTINALGGNVVLIGKTVDNEGTISAPRGTAGLVAGDDVLLAQKNADGSTITVSPKPTATSASGRVGVKNSGTIAAAAAELKAANGNIYALAVQNEGTIRATTVSHQGGHIWLTSDAGTVRNSGVLNASATAAGGQGGTVTVKSATGMASHTGQIVAQGGVGGQGGSADISGAQVQFTGGVDLTAIDGGRGTLFVDPATIDIVTGGGMALTGSTIDPGAIVTALNTSDVTLTGTTSITVDDLIDASANPNPGNLTLTTPALNLNAGIKLNGALVSAANAVNLGAGGLVQNGIDAVLSGGTVNLASGATYALPGEVVINKNVNLKGNGATLNGQGSTRIMEIDGGTVALDSLTLMGGNGNSSAGASGGSWSYDGGALLVYGQNTTSTVTITNSTFVGNSANGGGAIFSVIISGGSNSLSISNCTFTSNSAINGAVLYNYGSFGGNATMTLANDTIAGNSGTGAIYNTLLSSGNASVTIGSSILAGNTAFSGESDYVNGGGGTLTDLGYNLYGQAGNGGGFVPGSMGATDVLLSAGLSSVLTPLANFGGPTSTMALVAGSPALGAGDPAYIGLPDQRGINRGSTTQFTDLANDIGAYEAQFIDVQANPVSIVYGTTPNFTYTVTSGPTTLVSGAPGLFTGATSVGFYPGDIQVGTLTTPPSYILNVTPGDLTITPRPVTVDPDPGQGKVYGSPDPVLTYTTDPATTTSGLVNGDTLSGAPSYDGAGQFTNVGNYATNLGTLANGNYTISLSSSAPTFAITPRPVTVDPYPQQGKIYGWPDPVLGYTTNPVTTTTGLVNGDTLSGAMSYAGAGQFSPVGNYATNLGTLANSNYTIGLSSAAPTFAITPAVLYYVADPITVPVGATFPVFTGTVAGFVGSDTLATATTGTLTFATPVAPGAPAGIYSIDGSGLSASNYVFMQAAVNSGALLIGSAMRAVGTTPASAVAASSDPATPIGQALAQNNAPPPGTNPGGPIQPGVGPSTPVGPSPPSGGPGTSSISPNEFIGGPSDNPQSDPGQAGGSSGGGLAQGSSFDAATPSGTSGPGAPAGSSTPAGPAGATAAAAAGGASAPAAPAPPLGPATMVAPGQTIALAGGKSGMAPPPVMVQTQFDQGFAPESRNTLSAALTASKAAGSTTPTSPNAPKSTAAATMVAPGQTVALAAGHSALSAPPPMVQASFDSGFSPQSRDVLAKACGL